MAEILASCLLGYLRAPQAGTDSALWYTLDRLPLTVAAPRER